MPKLLTVDDEPDVLYITRRILEDEGFSVTGVTSGDECLKRVKEDKPDVILLDVRMPGIDGWEVCKKLKEDDETKSIPVVMFTVMSEDIYKTKSFEYAHADWHVPKPFETEDLLDVVRIATKSKSEIEKEINEILQKEERRKEVLKMLNPKLMAHKYDF
ncbi:MAG: PleD family two-component system response regulator [Candidatus Hydrothermarchaeales archaeon]